MAVERRLHHPALDAAPAPVDDADLTEPGLRSGGHVFLHDRGDVAGRERVEIELGLDGSHPSRAPRPARQDDQARRYSAVTMVVMPPRTEKSPTTVIRRGCRHATRSSRIWLVAFS